MYLNKSIDPQIEKSIDICVNMHAWISYMLACSRTLGLNQLDLAVPWQQCKSCTGTL